MANWLKRLLGADTASATDLRLDERVAAMEKEVRDIRLDWDETFDKFRRLYARMSKRIEREKEGQGDLEDDAALGTMRASQGARERIRKMRGF